MVKAIFEELLQLPTNINKDILLSNFAMTTPIDFYVCDLYCLFITLTQSQQNTFLVYETTISHLIDVEEQKKLWLR